MVRIGRVIAAAICAAAGASALTAQQLAPLRPPPGQPEAQGITYGVDKIANTFLFTGLADVFLATALGTVRFVNNYRGSAFRTTTTALRDDQYSNLSWSIPVAPSFWAVLRQSWTLSRDSRSLGLSSLERLNGALGARWQPSDVVDVDLMAGVERTSQIGVGAVGSFLGLEGRISGASFDDWQLDSRLLADYHRMDAARTNADLIAEASIRRVLDEGTDLRVSAAYTNVGREYFTTLAIGATDVVVESRGEERMNVDAALRYA
ncbi:MAG: hypothetical protein FGM24_09500, partial [Candidatus Kapabacteria bacterium]|nr:hypothetical protein [Candidatus Kapabacteria bacterium]